jgi:mercuric ion transport protein
MPKTPKTLTRRGKRWGLPAIGLAAIACVACCALPLVAAGGILGGGLALLSDPCFTPVWIGLLVIGVAASVVWLIRARNKSRCGDDSACGCTPDSEVDVTQSETAEPRP